jgi:hypothetical protein
MSSPGDVLGQRYTLRKVQWTSALGQVWAARDGVLDRQVLVQVLSPRLAGDAKAKRAFQKSAARIAQVTHPAVLQVFDIGDDPPFVVFEFAGARLSDRLAAGRLTPNEAARAALALARGVEAMHAAGEAHEAISPDCVLFDEEGRAKLFANGAATTAPKAAAKEQPPTYRAPEQDASPQDADRYALAALAHHMVTGGAPGESARKRPPGLDELLARALSPAPAARPSLPEFIAALAPYARVEPAPVRRGLAETSSDFRWLGLVVAIVALAAAAIVFGPKMVRDLARSNAPPAARSTQSAATKPVANVDVRDFDPGGDGSEHPNEVGRVVDGDPLTQWETEGYGRAAFGSKPGVGLVFDLGAVADVRRIRVQTSRAGWQAEIRVADVSGAQLEDFKRVTSFTAGSDTSVALPAGTRARYVLLWITTLADDGSGSDRPFRASVSEVSFFA